MKVFDYERNWNLSLGKQKLKICNKIEPILSFMPVSVRKLIFKNLKLKKKEAKSW